MFNPTRRSLLLIGATAACGAKTGLAVPATCGGLNAGQPGEYDVDSFRLFELDATLDGGAQAAIVVARDAVGFFAVSSVCTHQLCILDVAAGAAPEAWFVCPCHGASYTREGEPTRSFFRDLPPLPHYPVALIEGRLCVDTTRFERDRTVRLIV